MIRIDAGAYILGALLLLTLPLPWLAASLAAAAFHEGCHALAVYACGGQIWALRIGCTGAVMEVSPLRRWPGVLCALAGPLGSLWLVIWLRLCPRLALCGLFQGLCNLLPIYPLDGGRILRMLLPRGSVWIGRGFLLLLGAVCLHWRLYFVLLLLLLRINGKKPCKSRPFGVQ